MKFSYKENAQIMCPKCGHIQHTDYFSKISLQEYPNAKRDLMNGDLFLRTCEQCGEEVYVDEPLFYVDSDTKFALSFCQDDQFEQLEDNHMALGYTVRRVDNCIPFIEKMIIHEKGLKDTYIELQKAVSALILSEVEFDTILFSPEGDNLYFDVILEGDTVGRFDYFQYMYDDLVETFGNIIEEQYSDELIINEQWALDFFAKHAMSQLPHGAM